MTTEMVASTLTELNVTLKRLLIELHSLDQHLDGLERAVGASEQRLREDGARRAAQARAMFPDLKGIS